MTGPHRLKNSVEYFEAQYKERGLSAQRLYPNEQLIQFIGARYFRLCSDDRRKIRILEIGCGSGANLWMLAKEGFETYGVDSSPTAISLANQHLQGKWGVEANLQTALFNRLPFADNYFDTVCDVVSLQHTNLAESREALQEVKRVLQPGGEVFSLRLSDASTMYRSSGGTWIDAVTVDNIVDQSMPLANNGPTSFWSPALAQQIYQDLGFGPVSIERYGRTYDNGAKHVEYLAITAVKPV